MSEEKNGEINNMLLSKGTFYCKINPLSILSVFHVANSYSFVVTYVFLKESDVRFPGFKR